MSGPYGYDGHSTQRVVAVVEGHRKVLAWGDDITEGEVAPFLDHYGHVIIETVDDPAVEALTYPRYDGGGR